ncbi:MAG: hypothetical protein OXU67_10325 [Chloroflexota bacterium]|nr:hypothetical protein [Chloroflexota bacterium]
MRRFCFICGALLLTSGSLLAVTLIVFSVAIIGEGPGELGMRVVIGAAAVASIAAIGAGIALAGLGPD